jgi:hypothetical protein
MPPEAASPQIYCAMLISETWMHFHRRYPSVHNQKPLRQRTFIG